jgi:hypothetical protein
MHNLGYVMPSFLCNYTLSKDIVHPNYKNCTFDFHYDFSTLSELDVPFIFNNEVEKVLGLDYKQFEVDLRMPKMKRCSVCLLHLSVKDLNQNAPPEQLKQRAENIKKFISPNPRSHGCC